ncbi:MAG TPA: ATP-grasp domain-containing protein [Gemmatimonadales bacterium]|nr:ATP-grasp domain-containing protein [Gemmatimonadales bacterium]
MPRVLIAGIATRAFAESAVQAGYEVVAVDGFGDLDLRACAAVVVRTRDREGRFSARRAATDARLLASDAVAYVASFENHPASVGALARDRILWGNPASVLKLVRDPLRLARALSHHDLPGPATSATRPSRAGRWLVKPRASGGGHGIARWNGGRSARGSYWQEWVPGIPGSIVFAADGRRAVALGFSRMLVGERGLGAAGWRYCGSILSSKRQPQFPGEAALFDRTLALATVLTAEFGLVGVNGVDFIARGGIPYPVEVNPRPTASMELAERAYGLSVFEIHAQACGGALPAFDLRAARADQHAAIGKGIVYAREDAMVGDTRSWLGDRSVRDIPAPGEAIAGGRPVCTVFAQAAGADLCHEALLERARAVYRALGRRTRSIA